MNRRKFFRFFGAIAALPLVAKVNPVHAKVQEKQGQQLVPYWNTVQIDNFRRQPFDSDASFHLRRAAHEAFEKAGYKQIDTRVEERDYGNIGSVVVTAINTKGEQVRAFYSFLARDTWESKKLMKLCELVHDSFQEIANQHRAVDVMVWHSA